MSRVKAKELRDLSKQELEQKQVGLQKELHDLRQKKITGQLEKPHLFRQVRRNIARIETLKREKK